MALIAKLDVLLTATTEDFNKKMKSANKYIDDLIKSVAGWATSGFSGFFVGAGAAIGASLVGIAKAYAPAIDANGKMAQRLGVTTEQMYGLTAAAGRSGVDIDGAGKAFAKFEKNLSEASSGSSEANEAFQALGLDAKKLANMPLPDALGKFSDAFKGVDNNADKVRIAMKALGKSGYEMIPTLELGSAGLKKMESEAKRMGLAVSGQETAGVQEMTRAYGGLGKAITGFFNQVTVVVAPFIGQFVNGIKECMITVTGWFMAIKPGLTQFILTTKAVFVSIAEMVGSLVGIVFGWMGQAANAIGFNTKTWDNWGSNLRSTLAEIEFFFTHWKDMMISMVDELSIGLAKWFTDDATVKTLTQDYQKRIDALGKDLAKFKKQREELGKAPKVEPQPKFKADFEDKEKQEKLHAPEAAVRNSEKAAEAMLAAYGAQQGQIDMLREANELNRAQVDVLRDFLGIVKEGVVLAPANG